MAAEDEGGEGIPQLSFPGGQGPGGEAGPREPLVTEPGERTSLHPLLQLQPDGGSAQTPCEERPPGRPSG